MSERERIVERVATIERELQEPHLSQDTLVSMHRSLTGTIKDAAKHGLPSGRGLVLLSQMEHRMDEESIERANENHRTPRRLTGVMTGREFIEKVKRESGGGPVQIISNPVNPDGSLTPEAQAAMNAAQAPAPAPVTAPVTSTHSCAHCQGDIEDGDEVWVHAHPYHVSCAPEETCEHPNKAIDEDSGLPTCPDCGHVWQPVITHKDRETAIKDLMGDL